MPQDRIALGDLQNSAEATRILGRICGFPMMALRHLSTSFHRETDEQTEMVNQIVAQYLQIDVSYKQDDLHTSLLLAELSYNNAEH